MSLHPKLQLFIWADKAFSTPIQDLPPAVARRAIDRYFERIGDFSDGAPLPMFKVEQHTLPGWRGDEIRLQAYYSTQTTESKPAIMFFHGGGFVVGSLEVYDRLCRHIARDTGAVVLSVDYRLAPEYRYPTAAEDCYAATNWAIAEAKNLGIDSQRLAVMGDSAGGNLATAVSLMARDRGGPTIQQQILIYPVTDLTLSTPSSREKGQGYWLTRQTMAWYAAHYTPEAADRKALYASMMLAEPEQLRNLPPTIIVTAEYDPLVDEGAQYAQKLAAAGNEVEYQEYKGMIHGFYMMGRMLKTSRKARMQVAQLIRERLMG